jgi:DNA-directed RNA polymerase sigma subunit (sigma70/sigma32)
MNSWPYIVLIVAIVFTASTIRRISENRNARKDDDPDTEDLLAKIDVLEDRIRVLERIVTERKYDLEREINSL